MRNLLVILGALLISFSSCKKETTNNQPDTPAPTGFGLRYMQLEEDLFGGILHLYGNFGDSSASSKVKVGNVLIDGQGSYDGIILKWDPWAIKLRIGDPNDNSGGGYVSVFNKGKETNKRMLNIWELNMLYKQPDNGTILKEVRFKAFLRGDVDPHNMPVNIAPRNSFASKSEAYWAIGGQGQSTYPGGGMTISLENRNGILFWSKPYTDAAGDERAFQSEVTIENGEFVLTGLRVHKKKATKHSYLAHGSTAPFIQDYDFSVEVIPLNEEVKLPFDAAQAIKAGTFITGPHGTQYDFTWSAAEAPNHMYHYTLQWEKAEARFRK